MGKDSEIDFQKNTNEKYTKFFEKFKEISTLDVDNWKPAHILGYFCMKYKDKYNIEYSWKFNTPQPSKSFEVWQVNTLAIKLSSKPSIIKEYIDWVFDNKVKNLKRRFTSISFLTKEENLSAFKYNLLQSNSKTIKRTTILPTAYKNIFLNINKNIETYGDLSFLFLEKETSEDVKRAFEQIKMLGFNEDIIGNIV